MSMKGKETGGWPLGRQAMLNSFAYMGNNVGRTPINKDAVSTVEINKQITAAYHEIIYFIVLILIHFNNQGHRPVYIPIVAG